MTWVALLLLLSDARTNTRTKVVQVEIRCPSQADPDILFIAIQRPDTPEETDTPIKLEKVQNFRKRIPEFVVTSEMLASLRLNGMRTDCHKPKIENDQVAYYIFGCAKKARSLVVTTDPPDLSLVYERRFNGATPENRCRERGRISGETTVDDVAFTENLILEFGGAKSGAPGVDPKKIPWPLKPRFAAMAPAGKRGASPVRGNPQEPTLDFDAATLDRIQFQAEFVRQVAFDTGYLSSIEFDYSGNALKNFKRITIGPVPAAEQKK
jgi:hypothetical protein